MILLAISGAPVVAEADAGAASSSLIPATHLSGAVCVVSGTSALPLQLSTPVGAENLIRRTDQGRCTRRNVGTCRATYVPLSVAPAVRQDPDGDLEVLVSNPIGVFGTHRPSPPSCCQTRRATSTGSTSSSMAEQW